MPTYIHINITYIHVYIHTYNLYSYKYIHIYGYIHYIPAGCNTPLTISVSIHTYIHVNIYIHICTNVHTLLHQCDVGTSLTSFHMSKQRKTDVGLKGCGVCRV